MPAKLKQIKRKRGGQKGNHNARKHGIYSSALTPDEICRFWNILNQESLAPEMAVLRIKLQSLVHQTLVNRRVLREVVKLIVKWSVTKYRLNAVARTSLKAAVVAELERCSGIILNKPERLLKQHKNLKNE
jgi:hypothetical protein